MLESQLLPAYIFQKPHLQFVQCINWRNLINLIHISWNLNATTTTNDKIILQITIIPNHWDFVRCNIIFAFSNYRNRILHESSRHSFCSIFQDLNDFEISIIFSRSKAEKLFLDWQRSLENTVKPLTSNQCVLRVCHYIILLWFSCFIDKIIYY